jgi:membrane-bound lytic murein transglycosylase A
MCSGLSRRPMASPLLLIVLLLMLGACARQPAITPLPPAVVEPPENVAPLLPVPWESVSGWLEDDPVPALQAFVQSCQSLRFRPQWQTVCAEAVTIAAADSASARFFFEERFIPHQVRKPDGSDKGMITGYYVPDLKGSRIPTARYRYPLFAVPDDLLVIDLRSVYPELGDYRLRGRIEGRRVVPYWNREDIDSGKATMAGRELFWVEDAVELFFLQIQGSGRINLENGERVMVNYAEQNGHPYRSIGKTLIERGEMTSSQMSMQNIKAWARKNPDRTSLLLNENPSYVFFRELPADVQSPPGALGVPLTPGRSIAVDPRTIPLGAPVFVNTTWPNSPAPLNRLMLAQDTGGAIKGPVRADFFWGMGDQAGELAGRMKQDLRLWVLLPREAALEMASSRK